MLKAYPGVPPVTLLIVMLPSELPKHNVDVESDEADNAAGSVIVAESTKIEQPLLSIRLTA